MKYIGVKQNKVGSWVATYACRYLGSFSNEREAAEAVDDYRMSSGGDYGRLNFPERHQRPTTKICGKCQTPRPIETFRGRQCHECLSKKNKLKLAEYKRANGHSRSFDFRSANFNNFVSSLLGKIKYRATKTNRDFSLSVDDILKMWISQNGRCAITGDEITIDVGRGHVLTNLSIDRRDSDNGYTKDNIQLCTVAANRSKQTMTMVEFVDFCKRVVACSG